MIQGPFFQFTIDSLTLSHLVINYIIYIINLTYMYILYTPFDPQYMKILKWNDNSWKGKNIVIFLMSFQEGKKKKKKKPYQNLFNGKCVLNQWNHPVPTLVRGGSSIWAMAHWQNVIYLILEVNTTFNKNLVCLLGGKKRDANNIGNWSSTFGKFHILVNLKYKRFSSIAEQDNFYNTWGIWSNVCFVNSVLPNNTTHTHTHKV